MSKSFDDFRDLSGDGALVIYLRKDVSSSPVYQARIRVKGGKYIRRSTKQSKLTDAIKEAWSIHESLSDKIAKGETRTRDPDVISFKHIKADWVVHMRARTSGRKPGYADGQERILELHIAPFFDDIPINEISETHINQWLQSKVDSEEPPANSTLKKQLAILKNILHWLWRDRRIDREPEVPQVPRRINPRPDIPRDEWRKVYRYLDRNVKTSPAYVRRKRLYLQNYCLILYNSGLRVGEARDLRWADIATTKNTLGEEQLTLNVRGKTGRRTVVMRGYTFRYFERLWKQRTIDLGGKEPDKTEHLFCHPDGRPIHSFKNSFRQVLEETGLLYDSTGTKRVIYSLRHSYINNQIANGVDVYLIASNCGTSVQMIEQFYGKSRVRDPRNVDAITGSSGDSKLPRLSQKLPWQK